MGRRAKLYDVSGERITVAQAAERLGYLSGAEAEKLLDPRKMV